MNTSEVWFKENNCSLNHIWNIGQKNAIKYFAQIIHTEERNLDVIFDCCIKPDIKTCSGFSSLIKWTVEFTLTFFYLYLKHYMDWH